MHPAATQGQPARMAAASADCFLSEADTLIVSPGLFERAPLRQPSDIASHVLLMSETRPGNSADWLESAGLPHRAEQRRRVFDHFFVTLQAVVDGLGIEIGPLPVLQTDVAAGRLLRPFPRSRFREPATSPSFPSYAMRADGRREAIAVAEM